MKRNIYVTNFQDRKKYKSKRTKGLFGNSIDDGLLVINDFSRVLSGEATKMGFWKVWRKVSISQKSSYPIELLPNNHNFTRTSNLQNVLLGNIWNHKHTLKLITNLKNSCLLCQHSTYASYIRINACKSPRHIKDACQKQRSRNEKSMIKSGPTIKVTIKYGYE